MANRAKAKAKVYYDSDALDDDSHSESASDFGSEGNAKRKRKHVESSPAQQTRKQKRAKTATTVATTTTATATTKRGKWKGKPGKKKDEEEDEHESESEHHDEDEEDDLEGGQEIVGRVVQAPTTGRVPSGQISRNTLAFLTRLTDPACNDRGWFKLHEPVYRAAESEWKSFIDALTPPLTAADPQVPHLPPKDVVHRIYRDVRFSNDKTPYKHSFSASFSRSGRKGVFAGLKPGGESLIAAGSWCPGRAELANIRTNIKKSSRRLRRVLAAPEFVAYFGEPKPSADGTRRSVFGMEDELKVAPKGVDKSHPDIDLLKCRSFAVVHQFTDEEVLAPDFKEKVSGMVNVMRPFVHCLNDLMTVNAGGTGGGSSDSEEGEGAEEEDEDEDEEDG